MSFVRSRTEVKVTTRVDEPENRGFEDSCGSGDGLVTAKLRTKTDVSNFDTHISVRVPDRVKEGAEGVTVTESDVIEVRRRIWR